MKYELLCNNRGGECKGVLSIERIYEIYYIWCSECEGGTDLSYWYDLTELNHNEGGN